MSQGPNLKPIFFLMALLCLPSIAFEELPLEGELQEMPKDIRSVGWQWHYVDQNGQAGYMEKISETTTTNTYRRTDGCHWTRSNTGFAPALEWHNCPSSGTSEYRFSGEGVWPLQVGAQFSYIGTGESTLSDRTWKIERKCEVVGTTSIRTVAGVFDTYKVQCKDRWSKRTWWLAPTVGTAVRYSQSNLLGEQSTQEMTHIVSPTL